MSKQSVDKMESPQTAGTVSEDCINQNQVKIKGIAIHLSTDDIHEAIVKKKLLKK